MKILFVAAREQQYPRNDVILRAFQKFAYVDVVVPLRRPRSLVFSSLKTTTNALLRLGSSYDMIFIGFYGYIILGVLSFFFRNKPVLFDPFVSNYDTLCFDRQIYSPSSLVGKIAFHFDQFAFQRATHLLADTESHAAYFQNAFFIPSTKVTPLPVGCNEEIFVSSPLEWPRKGKEIIVIYASSFLPIHGVDIVVKAASYLYNRNVPARIQLVGCGPEYRKVKHLCNELDIKNVEFIPFLPIRQLAFLTREAQICLGGHFSQIPKATRVIPTKVYQALAVGRPLIAADHPGNRELLQNGVNALLVPPTDPLAVAQAIEELILKPDVAYQLAQNGRITFTEQCSEKVIRTRLEKLTRSLLSRI